MNLVFEALFYTRETLYQINQGVPKENFLNQKCVHYKTIMVATEQVESIEPSFDWEGHSVIVTKQGSEFVIKLRVESYLQIVDHAVADKLVCKLNN
jgi:hypothetical protein